MKLVHVGPKTRADTFLNRDQVITTEEYIEVRNLQLARDISGIATRTRSTHGRTDEIRVARYDGLLYPDGW